MSTPALVSIGVKRNEELVHFASDLLDRCKAGEITSLTVLEELSGGHYKISASASKDRIWTAGALLEAAISRLSD